VFRYTPYDGSKQPFSIGLELLDPERWVEPDDLLASEIALKEELIAQRSHIVCAETDGSHTGQAEARDRLSKFLTTRYADRYQSHMHGVTVVATGRTVRFDDGAMPLVHAARLVQDDLCLMRRGPQGWHLAAGVVCFPSAWALPEKVGLSMDAIHVPVPGFAGRMAGMVARIFDHLPVDRPVWRLNWSLYDDAQLHHPEPKQGPRHWAGGQGRFGTNAFVRVERQTLTKLPGSGDILFTIRIHLDPVEAFASHPRGRELAAGLARQLAGLDADQLAYKGLTGERERLLAGLAAYIG
jgi:hypothetical protein